jgi:hypothetical protein
MGRSAIRWSVGSVLLCLSSAGCGRTGLGAFTDAAGPDLAVEHTTDAGREPPAETAPDSPDSAADGSKADGAPDARWDGLAEVGNAHCTPGLFTLGGLPVPRIPGPPWAMAIGDLDGDGRADVAMTESELDAVAVLLGRGDGTFAASSSFATGRAPAGVAIADVDGDGEPDLTVANSRDDTVSVLLGTGNGNFAAKADYPAGSEPGTIAVGDFTGDGRPDIAVASTTVSGTGEVTVLRNRGNGTFSLLAAYPTGVAPKALAMGDLDGDGRADLAVAGWFEAPLTLLFGGDGGAVVTRIIDDSANAIVMGDLDGDGSLDLAWSTGDAIRVALNQGGAVFAPTVEYAAGPVQGCPSYGLSIGDLNADGRPDLIALNDDCANVTVLLNQGDGSFTEPNVLEVDGYPFPMGVGDLNGDHRADLVLNVDGLYLDILLARPDGSLTPAWLPASDSIGDYAGAIGDLDGDGNLDLVRAEDGVVAVWLGRSDGTLAARARIQTTATPQVFDVLDANGDGTLDVACWGGSDVTVLPGRGHGDLGAPVTTTLDRALRSVAFGDLDGDGDADLATASWGTSDASVLFNRGDGSFGEPKQYGAGRFASVGIGDLNADGKLDLVFVSAPDQTVSLWFGRGDGSFDAGVGLTVTGAPQSPFLADLNGDGITDLIVTSHNPDYHLGVLLGRKGSPGVLRDVVVDFSPDTLVGSGDLDKDGHTDLVFRSGTTLFVLRGSGDGNFVETLAYRNLRGNPMALADFDRDGRLDVVVAEGDTPRWRVYRNDLCQ